MWGSAISLKGSSITQCKQRETKSIIKFPLKKKGCQVVVSVLIVL